MWLIQNGKIFLIRFVLQHWRFHAKIKHSSLVLIYMQTFLCVAVECLLNIQHIHIRGFHKEYNISWPAFGTTGVICECCDLFWFPQDQWQPLYNAFKAILNFRAVSCRPLTPNELHFNIICIQLASSPVHSVRHLPQRFHICWRADLRSGPVSLNDVTP